MIESAPSMDTAVVQELHEFTIEKVTHQTLMGAWAYVRKGLVKVKANSHAVTWTPEQVKREVVNHFLGQNGCELFLCKRGERVVGFYIMIPSFDPFLQLNYSWTVWVMYASEPGVLDGCAEPIASAARERGYAAIDFITSQDVVAKKASKHGYKRIQVLCRKDLEY